MTLPGFFGVAAALAFVLGLLFLAVRLARHLPALSRGASEGPELKVLGRAGLTPRQGVATVRVGDRTLVVGYGDGGVRLLGEANEAAAAQDGTRAEETDTTDDEAEVARLSQDHEELRPGGLGLWGDETPSPRGMPFRKALARAIRRASIFGWALAASGVVGAFQAEPLRAAPVTVDSPAGTTLLAVPAPTLPATLVQTQDPVTQPQVEGPRTPVTPTVPRPDFPSVDVTMGEGEDALRLSGPVGTVLFVGFLTLLPTLLLLMTSFTRILVVLHLLKQAIGTQTAPPAHLLSAMALLLTGFVMAPTLSEANRTGVQPWMQGQIDEVQMLDSASVPFRAFMLSHVRDSDVETFLAMRDAPAPETVDDVPLVVVSSAFVVSELRSAFQMGFALFLPFVIIDIVVASVLMSMGMFMLPPVMVSLPFKLLLFVMVDGWALVVGSLVRSFG